MTSAPIQLDRCQLLAQGNNREVYVHPADPDLLIKVIKPEVRARRAASNRFSTKRWKRRYRHYLGFLRECQEHLVSRVDGDAPPLFQQQLVGFVETDRGLGLVTRAERDRSGAYARSLRSLIEDGRFDGEARLALEACIQAVLASRVILTDLSPQNLVYAYSPEHGSHFVVIDGYGEKNFIPLNSLFACCHRRSKRKRIARLRQDVQAALERCAARQTYAAR
jgi:hypothetical protein